jgi:hypothetical protein
MLFFFLTPTSNGLFRAFACTGIGFSPLTPDWESLAMAASAESANIYQALDIHRYFTSQVTFYLDVFSIYNIRNPCDLIVFQVLDPDIRIHISFR